MARLRNFWRRLAEWLVIPSTVAIILLVLGVLIVVGGYLYHHCECQSWPNVVAGWEQEFEAFYANVATTLIGIAIVVLFIDTLNERRAERQRIEREQFAEQLAQQQLKAQLIREMGSPDNGIALRAVNELRARGWLTDGSLKGVHLAKANLQGAQLQGADLESADLTQVLLQGASLLGTNLERASLTFADLREADLSNVNLRNAKIHAAHLARANLSGGNLEGVEAYYLWNSNSSLLSIPSLFRLELLELVKVSRLAGATMYDGKRYDGRFNLVDDIWAHRVFWETLNPYGISDEEYQRGRQEWEAHRESDLPYYYGIPLETYLAGQEWARENLPRLRREAGIEQKVVPETGEVPQSEEQQSTAPSSSAPPRAGYASTKLVVVYGSETNRAVLAVRTVGSA